MGTDKGRTVPWPFCLILADEKIAYGRGVSRRIARPMALPPAFSVR